jgi:hypothetical protein
VPSGSWPDGLKKIFCVPLCAELHEGVERLRKLQNKPEPVVNGKAVVSITSLMATMVAAVVPQLDRCCLLVADAYFSVGTVFSILKQALDAGGARLAHIVTRAKDNVVGYEAPPPKTGRRGAPRKYGRKIKLINLFEDHANCFQEMIIDIYGQQKTLSYLCLDLFWKPIKDKVRFVLVLDGKDRFVLMCSDLGLCAADIVRAYSYRFKIEVNFKVLKHLMGVFFYHFWTSVWPRIGKGTESDLSKIEGHSRSEDLIQQAANAIEGFVNFGFIATGILQILALNFDRSIWKKYSGWMRTYTSAIPSEEMVRSVIQEEYFHNFSDFSNSAIHQIIMSKSTRRHTGNRLSAASTP